MINKMPENWKGNSESLEMLFFFYQVSEELLNEKTPDSFALPMHNAITLLIEMAQMNLLIKQYGIEDQYYSKYIPVIIDEFISQLRSDSVIKSILKHRYESMLTGFENVKDKPNHLDIWLESFQQAVSFYGYIDSLKKKIVELMASKKNKHELQQLIANFYIMLIASGYSKEYLWKELSFFEKTEINDENQIEVFFNLFTFKNNSYDFLILIDYQFFEFLEKVDEESDLFDKNQLQLIDVANECDELSKYEDSKHLLKLYNKLKNDRKSQGVRVARWSVDSIDPYVAARYFSERLTFLQTFPRYFNHGRHQTTVYRFLVKNENGIYEKIKLFGILNKKDAVGSELVEDFVKNIIEKKSMSHATNAIIMQAMEMHSSALEIHKILPMFQNLWTALETLFLSPSKGTVRENVSHSVVRIMQKIYILKLFRAVFRSLEKAVEKNELEPLGITDFKSFVKYISSYTDESDEMKRLYSLLSDNPLLRFRIYTIKKDCASEVSFCELLKKHQLRIGWHIERLYRMRNVATHIGQEIQGMNIAINHLHNYFDYIVNYILCKSANSDFVCGVTSVVHEAKNDEEIHEALIKQYKNISSENYMAWLFGPDEKMIDYSFDCL